MLPNGTDLRASILLGAFSAGLESLGYSTLSDLAQRTAEYGLGPVHTATIAIDVFRKNGRIVQFCPSFGSLLPQCLVIVLSSDVGVTLFAVQSANGNQLFLLYIHIIRSLLNIKG